MSKIILSTPRLLLRELTPADARCFFQLNADPEVVRYTGDGPFANVGQARSFLTNYDQYQRHGYGRWAVLHRNTGEWLGWCGLKFDPKKEETDVGFRFFQKNWGQGYATEAARACLVFGFEKLGLSRIVGRAMWQNGASVRVLEKIGMRYCGEFDFGGEPGVLYEALSGR